MQVCGVSETGLCPHDKWNVIDLCGICGGDNTSCTTQGIKFNTINTFLLLKKTIGICGDGFCNPEIGENCKNCIIDCCEGTIVPEIELANSNLCR